MKLKLIRDDTRGGVIIEYAVTMPLFFLLMFGLVQAGLLTWTQVGLQHGVEMAARCASVNRAANTAGLNPTNCLSQSTVTSYAAQNSYGLNPGSTYFSATLSTTCGTNPNTTPGNLVTVAYPFNLINYIFNLTLHAQSCYPS